MTTTRTRRMLIAAVALAAVACIGCQKRVPGSITPPAPDAHPMTCEQDPEPSNEDRLAAGLAPCGVELTAPAPDGHLIVGDSITWQAQYAWLGGVEENLTGLAIYGAPGWTLRHTLPHLRTLDHASVDLIVATGTNETNPITSGWDARDDAALAEVQAMGFRSVVMVLPALGPGATGQHATSVEQARSLYVQTGFPTIDWRQWAAQPGIIDTDYIHLRAIDSIAVPEAVAARKACLLAALAA